MDEEEEEVSKTMSDPIISIKNVILLFAPLVILGVLSVWFDASLGIIDWLLGFLIGVYIMDYRGDKKHP